MKWIIQIVGIGLILAGCAGEKAAEPNQRSTDPQMIIGKTWQWVMTVTPVERITVSDPERYTILLNPDKRVQARFDCNRGGGSYTIAAGKIAFGPMMSTRMACPPDSLDAAFIRDLQRAASFFVLEGALFLELPYDSGTMRFRQASASEPTTTPAGDTFNLRGTVVYKEIEGGFFAIEGEDGKTYAPVNLPESFKKNGLKVKADARLKSDVMGIHMVGPVIEIVKIVKQ